MDENTPRITTEARIRELTSRNGLELLSYRRAALPGTEDTGRFIIAATTPLLEGITLWTVDLLERRVNEPLVVTVPGLRFTKAGKLHGNRDAFANLAELIELRRDELAEPEPAADERDFPSDEDLGYHGRDEVPAGHPDELDYQGFDEHGGQPCPHNPHWRHCSTCNVDLEASR
jgi:hypothetical protein